MLSVVLDECESQQTAKEGCRVQCCFVYMRQVEHNA
jgi:hypothetical protein